MAYLKAPSPDLFDAAFSEQLRVEAPLADRLRPQSWADFVGQTEAVGAGTPLRKLIDQDQVPSIIFWPARQRQNHAGAAYRHCHQVLL